MTPPPDCNDPLRGSARHSSLAGQSGGGVKKVIIGIVAYNAEATLNQVLDRIPLEVRQKVSEVVVFDDESKDHTYEVATHYQLNHPHFKNFYVYRNPHNLGYGGNQKRCYRYCLDKGVDIVVLLHGDGQYAPEALPGLLEPLERGEADAVFGSRMMAKGAARRGGMPLYKYAGNKILTAYENAMLGMSLTEFHSGYRLYSVAALKQIPFEKNTNNFHFDTEIIVQFHAKGLRIRELPIPTYYGDEICYVNGLKYAWNVARSVFQYKLHERGLAHYAKYDVGARRYSFKKDRHSSHGQVLEIVPASGQKILDVGCGPGELAHFLKGDANEIVGVDQSIPDRAEDFTTIRKDIESDFSLAFGREFDFVLFLDILEHLKHPERVLEKARAYLKKGGRIIVSVPNVAHWTVRLSLLAGVFRYGDKGILDKTHLHFYTLKSFRQLLKEANYKILEIRSTPLPLLDSFPVFRFLLLRWIPWLDVGLSRLWKTLFAYQFIFVAEDTLLD